MHNNNKGHKGVIILLFVGVLIGALDISIVGPAIPSIENSLKIDTQFVGWIFSIYVLFNLTGISLFARLSDIYGRRIIYIFALSTFALGSLWVSLAESFTSLLIGRAIQGIGASGIFPVASAVVGDLFPPERRGRILGLIGAVFGIAFLIGPFVAGTMLHFFEWHTLFLINIPIALVLIIYSFKLLPSNATTKSGSIDWWGISSLAFVLAGFTYALNNIKLANGTFDLLNLHFIVPFILLLVFAIVFLIVERRIESPIIKFSFFRNRQIQIVSIIALVTGMFQACFVFIPKYTVLAFSVSPSTASFMLSPIVLAIAVGSPFFGRMIDTYGVRIIVIIGLFLTAVGFFLLSQSHGQRSIFYLSGIFIGLGLSVTSGSSLRYIMLNNSSVQDRAISQGMLTIFISVGQLFGAAIIGFSLSALVSKDVFQPLFIIVAVLSLCMMLLAVGIKNADKM